MARGGQGDAHRLGHPRRRRRRAPRRRGRPPVTVSSGASPSGPVHLGNLREFLTVALRGRGAAPPRLAGPAPARVGRLRPVPQGAGRRRPGLGGAHRPPALGACPTRGSATTPGPSTSRRPLRAALAELGVEMEEVSQTELYRAGVYRAQVRTAIERRDEIETILARHRTKDARRRPTRGGRAADGGAAERARSGDLARFPFKPYCGTCGRDTLDLTDFDRPRHLLHLPGVRLPRAPRPRHRHRRQAGVEGRLADAVGLRARRLRARRASTMRRPARRTPSARSWWRSIFEMPPRRRWFGYAFVGFAGVQKMSSSAGGVAHRRRRAADPRGADPALALRPPAAQAGLQHRLRARGGPALRRVGRPGPQGRDQARRRGARLRAGRRDRDRRDPADPAGGGAVPDARLGRRRDGRVRRADQPDHRPRRARARLGRRPGAAAVPGDALDLGVRAGLRGPDDRPRPTPDADRLAALSTREADLAPAAPRPTCPTAISTSSPVTSLVYGVPKLALGLALDAARPTRSRPTRRSSSGSSTTCSSARTAARGCPR